MMESNYVEFTSLHNRYLLPYKLRRAIRRKILRAYLNQISEGKARIETIEIPAYRNIARIFERFDTFPILIPRIPYPSPFPSLLRVLREPQFATFAFFFFSCNFFSWIPAKHSSLYITTCHVTGSILFFSLRSLPSSPRDK